MLTPDYGVGCKRRIFDADWLQGLNDPRLELTTLPLTSISAHTVTLGKTPSDQTTIPADVIILANGFEVLRWFHPLSVTGRSGKTLQEVFDERGGPQMYLGAAMDGFPNFFTLFGPNTVTGHSSVVLASENMVNYALKFIAPILADDAVTVEVKESAEREWTRKVQAALKKTVWSNGGCRSWYLGEDGWNSTGFPWSQVWFTVLCMFPNYRHWDVTYTRKGLWKRRGKLALKTAVFVAALVGGVTAKREGWKLSDLRNLVVANVARSVGIAGQALAKVGKA
jgi:acyl dehydratase